MYSDWPRFRAGLFFSFSSNIFMEFKQLEVSDYHILKRFFKSQQYRLCNYSLLSLIVWSNQKLKTHYAVEDNTLIIYNKSTANPKDDHLILPISPADNVTPRYLFVLAEKLGFTDYWFVPEDFLVKYGAKEIEFYFEVNEQDAFDDYIYLRQDLILLKGNKYAKQRNLIHQFYKRYLTRRKVDIEMIDSSNARECVDFLHEWCELRKCDVDNGESLACEKMATINALNNIDRLEAKGLLIRIDGAVSAFGISSPLTDSMGVLNFEKAHASIKGLYQFLDNECAKRLFTGYTYINKESDMKLPNLAQSKKSYNPVAIVKSYRLTMRER
jgi:hypothetical protein